MVENPYDVLGVSRSATLDEVKKAYRKKARENHPDLNPNDPGAIERMNKINEAYDRITNPEKYAASDRRANAAGGSPYGGSPYGQPGSSGAGSTGYGQPGSGYSGYGTGGSSYDGGGQQGGPGYGWVGFDFDDLFGYGNREPIHPEASAADSPELRSAITDINASRFQQASNTLNAVTSAGRTARWYYLSALANNGAGNAMMAFEQIRRAVQMEPGNPDYQRAHRQFQQVGQTYEQESQSQGFTMGTIDPATICCGLLFAQMICRMFMPMGF